MDEISKRFEEWMQKLIMENNKLNEENKGLEEECKDKEKATAEGKGRMRTSNETTAGT